MYLVSQDEKAMYNLDHVLDIYIDGQKLLIALGQRSYRAGEYMTIGRAKNAITIIANRMQQGNVIARVPSDLEASYEEKDHYTRIKGRKQKGHGGS